MSFNFPNQSIKKVRLILGDQLHAGHSWYKEKSDQTLYVIAELPQEVNYVKHHVQKICAFFAAMASFAEALQKAGHQVLHLTLDDTCRYKDLTTLLQAIAKQSECEVVQYQRPDEYRLLHQLRSLKISNVKIGEVDTEHFLLPFDEIDDYFVENKAQRMEAFYRKMRQRFSVLLESNGDPVGGSWNYDKENRESLNQQSIKSIPEPKCFKVDVADILDRLKKHQCEFFGEETQQIVWPVTRKQALSLLNFFCEQCLPNFGRYQDAMTSNSKGSWSLYHSRLSFALNSKLLSPKQVIDKAISHWEANEKSISIAQIEGFVRQILGWREFVRGIYWRNMPKYAERNGMRAQRSLPAYFWNGITDMKCVATAVNQSLEYAYAHHIQRLMVTGNFMALAGINPDEADRWYLGIYIDAIEWVELPNTRGMSQYADGGLLASKPYISSGNYINKMSDYCSSCKYSVKEKTSESACPFNSLYWDYIERHKKQLQNNPRMSLVYRNWDKQDVQQKKAVLKRAAWCLENIESM